ncbi:YSIRK-type signal peptide-containing protein [Gemella sp. 19428wG2_WT2a]|nr:YSIRK-type signal peptide-containing protein [Gemella sp. 19428wG2_WT2a]TFU58001.1 YSIRK-type signal peptide-containing protein [Gemella sp. WT2a]
MFKNKKNMEKQSFSIKKYSFGVTSTLVGLLLVGANAQAEEVKPETVAKATSSQASSTAPVTTKVEKETSTAPVTTKSTVTTSTAPVTTKAEKATSTAPATTKVEPVTTKAAVATTVATTEAPKTTVTTKEQVKSTTSSAAKTETPKVEVKKEQTPKTEVKKGVVKADYVAGEYGGPDFVLNSDMTLTYGEYKFQLEKRIVDGYVVVNIKNAPTPEMGSPIFIIPAGKELYSGYRVLGNPEDNDLTKDRILIIGHANTAHVYTLTKAAQEEMPVANKNMTVDKKATTDKNLAKAVETNTSSKIKVAEGQKSTKTTNTNKKVVDNKNLAKTKVESAKKVLPKTQAEKSNTTLPAGLALVLAAAGLMTIKARKN